MRVLILGSDGQIGAPLTNHLKDLGHDVVEFDNFLNPVTDLRVSGILNALLPTIDFVFFLAFDVGGSLYLKTYQDSFDFISNNVKIMNNTFDSLKRYDTPFIFTSSQMSNMSHSSYGILKHIGEKYTKCLNGRVVKFWNVYGFEVDLSKSHVITDFIMSAKKDGVINMRTDGEESRQFLYSDDCSECLAYLMDPTFLLGDEVFDITNFEWTKIIDVARMVADNFEGCVVNVNDKKDDLQKDALREPSRGILKHWQPKTSVKEGIKKIIELENKLRFKYLT